MCIRDRSIGDHARIARVEEPEPLPQPFGRRDAERRMRFAQGDQLPDVVEQPAVFGFQRPVDPVDGIGRAEAVRFALLVLHHLLAGADEGNALRREQDGVYPVSYTHLDVYKRQSQSFTALAMTPV